MAKQFIANRSGQTPTLDEVPNEVIKIYNDKAAADLDIANIEENEIVATKAGESEGVVEVVDTVEEDNPHPVSSGAVYNSCPRFPDYARGNLFSGSATNTYTAPEDCYIQAVLLGASETITISIDGVEVGVRDDISAAKISSFSGFLKKGQTITASSNNAFATSRFKVFGLI